MTRVPPEVTLQPSVKSNPGVGFTALIWVSIQGRSWLTLAATIINFEASQYNHGLERLYLCFYSSGFV